MDARPNWSFLSSISCGILTGYKICPTGENIILFYSVQPHFSELNVQLCIYMKPPRPWRLNAAILILSNRQLIAHMTFFCAFWSISQTRETKKRLKTNELFPQSLPKAMEQVGHQHSVRSHGFALCWVSPGPAEPL